ncbi:MULTISPECIES: hypothetical protein [unclassified Sphingobacterium]|uniref:hypothetical protein n=1 Tax=unclassified Sphingobacterium TaxID=2609468 RepID=UPI0025EBBD9A|nr:MULTISPECIES: hypothetical protein [unclassified Sphingobacterium]
MNNQEITWTTMSPSIPVTKTIVETSLLADQSAEDGVMRIGATRIGYAYIFEREGTNPPTDSDLIFQYDLAGNQIRRELKKIS